MIRDLVNSLFDVLAILMLLFGVVGMFISILILNAGGVLISLLLLVGGYYLHRFLERKLQERTGNFKVQTQESEEGS